MPMQRRDDADCFPSEVGASQGRVSLSTDVFCLGVELLSGEAPSRDGADGRPELLRVRMRAEPTRDPRTPDWPAAQWDALLAMELRCTAEREKDRPAMVQLLEELSSRCWRPRRKTTHPSWTCALRGAGVAACRSSRVWRRSSWRWRRTTTRDPSVPRDPTQPRAAARPAPCSSTPRCTARCPCRWARSSHQCTSTYSKHPRKQCIHSDHTRMHVHVHSQQ